MRNEGARHAMYASAPRDAARYILFVAHGAIRCLHAIVYAPRERAPLMPYAIYASALFTRIFFSLYFDAMRRRLPCFIIIICPMLFRLMMLMLCFFADAADFFLIATMPRARRMARTAARSAARRATRMRR